MSDLHHPYCDPAHLQILAQQAALREEVAGVDADIRRDVQSTSADVRREVANASCADIDATKTSAWNVADRVGSEADRVVAQDTAYFIASQAQSFANATAIAALKAGTDMAFAKTQSDIMLAQEKNATATALAASETQKLIMNDGAATRALINALNTDELNRKLIERNALIVEQRSKSECCHSQLSATLANAQQNQVLSAINAMNSQLQATHQGMVNLGVMAGVSQAANPTNIR